MRPGQPPTRLARPYDYGTGPLQPGGMHRREENAGHRKP